MKVFHVVIPDRKTANELIKVLNEITFELTSSKEAKVIEQLIRELKEL